MTPEEELKQINDEQVAINIRRGMLADRRKEVEAQLRTERLENVFERVKISDHALVRYLERVHGIDMDVLRRRLLTDQRARMILRGAKKIKADGFDMIVENNTVVTIHGGGDGG